MTLIRKNLFYVLLFLALFIPLYPKFPLLNIPGTYVAVRIEDVLILLTLLLWFVVSIKKIKSILSQTIYQSFVLFWIIGFVSVVAAVLIHFSVTPSLAILHLLRRVEYMSMFFLAATTIKSPKHIKIFLTAMLLATIVIVIYGFGQIYLKLPVISTTNREFSKGLILTLTADARPNSTFAGHYDLAAYLSFALIFMGTTFFYYKKVLYRGAILFTGAISSVMLALTAARISFLAAFLGIASALWLLGKRKFILGLILAAMIIVLAVPQLRDRLLATFTVNFLGDNGNTYVAPRPTPIPSAIAATASASVLKQLKIEATAAATKSAKAAGVASDIAPGEPVKYTDLDVYRSYNIRLNVEWPRALRALITDPLLGTGYSSLTIATDNDILRSLGETGILGTVALSLIFFIMYRRFMVALKHKSGVEKVFLIASICSIIAILITATFIDVLEASKIAQLFWLTMGIAWAISNNYEDES